jgi:hypothetical protein
MINRIMAYIIVSPRIGKNGFIIFPSHKIIVQNILSYRKLWMP